MASKSIMVAFLMVNLALFAFVSANAVTCPNLNACLDIADSLLHVEFGSQSSSECCQLLAGLVDADAAVCLCASLNNTTLGTTVGKALGLLSSLLGSLTGSILDQEILAIFNACALNSPTDYKCAPKLFG